ncbi:MAG: hypothetical protein A2X09_15130 [Bacteroidetes bacterium GWF2_43_11]|nr:MAG: hypothetical protein A2X09_15130 [Bacteroidetes bacterium GWF2_43_11]
MEKIPESLAGRVGLWTMYPLSFSPLEIQDQKQLLSNHQLWGGYPAVHNLENSEIKYRWLSKYKKTYLEKDVRDIKASVDIKNITRFQNVIAHRTGNLLSYTDVARDCGISVTTAQNYMKLFELTFQVHLLMPYYQNHTKRMIKSPKLYFLDTGLINVITGQYNQELSGNVYETWVFTELLKWSSTKTIPPELFFYRTSAGFEIDFIIKHSGNKLLPIEVKNTKKPFASDVTPLKKFIAEHPDHADRGILVYPGDEIIKFASNIWAIPDRMLFL